MCIDKETGLNPLQKAFCEAYIACKGNGAEAARQAGYKGKNNSRFASIASHNLDKPPIIQYIEKLSKSDDEKRIASVNESLEIMTERLRDPNELTANKIRIAELILRINGAFNDKLTIKQDGPIILAGDDYVPD